MFYCGIKGEEKKDEKQGASWGISVQETILGIGSSGSDGWSMCVCVCALSHSSVITAHTGAQRHAEMGVGSLTYKEIYNPSTVLRNCLEDSG